MKGKRQKQGVLAWCVLCVMVSVVVSLLPACGRKTAVRPPEFVAPKAIEDLKLTAKDTGIELRWGRPQTYADGSKMDDLGGFLVLRAVQSKDGQFGEFSQLTTVPVEDRDRFRQSKRFRFIDEQVSVGTRYQYRIQAFTLDGDYSTPSNTVEHVWRTGS